MRLFFRIMAPVPAEPVDFKPIDGGWGWVVVFGAHISIGFAYSLPKVLSIFYKEIQIDLDTSFSEIALVSSVMLAAVYGGGKPKSSIDGGGWAEAGACWISSCTRQDLDGDMSTSDNVGDRSQERAHPLVCPQKRSHGSPQTRRRSSTFTCTSQRLDPIRRSPRSKSKSALDP